MQRGKSLGILVASAMLAACVTAPVETAAKAETCPVVPNVPGAVAAGQYGAIKVVDYKCKDGSITSMRLLSTGPNIGELKWVNADRCDPGT